MESFQNFAETAGDFAETAATTYCQLKMVQNIIYAVISGIISAAFLYSYMHSENRQDLMGYIETSSDSHSLEPYKITAVKASETIVPATRVPNTNKQKCRTIQRGGRQTTECECDGPIAAYKYNNKSLTTHCGFRQGKCPTQTLRVKISENGNSECVFQKNPKVKCLLNNTLPCEFPNKCPEVGSEMMLPKDLSSGAFSCNTGRWNTCTLGIRYTTDDGEVRHQTIKKQTSRPCASANLGVGNDIPVYYSEQKNDITLVDENPADIFKLFTTIFAIIAIMFAGNAFLYTFKYVCYYRAGSAALDTLSTPFIQQTNEPTQIYDETRVW